jgi:BirA family biotin operon repressor/biotin-[acetyl-CoA-carboxylase] ligase
MKEKILHLLKNNEKNFVSGQKISEGLGVSRTSIWKYINALKEDGYEIESVSKRGYRLVSSPDILTFEEISESLHTKYIGKSIMYFQSLDSTNNKAKELANQLEDGSIIISEEQTAGKGRLGRNWVSPKYKGIWMSILLKPDVEPMNVPKVTQIGAAAVIKTLEELNIKAQVKWPNDIVLNNKKLCGILTEMSGELNLVNYVIMGIGINVNIDEDDFPQEVKAIATSLKFELGKYITRKNLVINLLNNFEKLYDEFITEGTINKSIDICRKNSILLGRDVKIISRGNETLARAIDLNEDGELIVQFTDGIIKNIFSGEVSVRGLYGNYTP